MVDRRPDPQAIAAVLFAKTAMDIADGIRGLVADLGAPHLPGERVATVRAAARVPTIALLDVAVLMEALAGTPWDVIADALGMSEGEARRRYQPTVDVWLVEAHRGELPDADFPDAPVYTKVLRPGSLHDPDPERTAREVDAWLAGHAPEGDASEPGPVTRALRALG